MEVLQAILSRPYNAHFHEPWSEIMQSVLQPSHIELLKNIYLDSNTPPDDIDEPKYTLQKKLSEVCRCYHDGARHEILLTLSGSVHFR